MIVKQLYHIIALLAVLNMVVLVGVLGYAWGTGALTGEKIEKLAAVLSADPEAEVEAEAEAEAEAAVAAALPTQLVAATEQVQRDAEMEEILLRRMDREHRELQNLKSTVEAARFKVIRDREALETQATQFAQMRKAWEEQQNQGGFTRSLAYLSSIQPKLARDLLKQKKDADVARILSQMKERKGRAIIEQCKTPEDQVWIGKILQMIEQGLSSPAEPVDTAVATRE